MANIKFLNCISIHNSNKVTGEGNRNTISNSIKNKIIKNKFNRKYASHLS